MAGRILLSIAQGLRDEAKLSDPQTSEIQLSVANEIIDVDISLHGITFGDERGYLFTPKKEAETLPNPFPRS